MKQTKKMVSNWFRVIIDLERSGYPHNAIATFVGVSRRTIGNWKGGASPRWDEGELLVSLWCQVTSSDREQVPKVSPYDYRS